MRSVRQHLSDAAVMCALEVAFATLSLSDPALAQQAFPNKAIKIIVGFQPGSASDVAARAVAPKMSEILKVPVVIENRAGAASDVAARYVASAEPDGYTLFLPTVANVINYAAKGSASTDIGTQMTPIAQIGEVPNILVVNPEVDARTVSDVIRLAKARPGELTYASAGSGSALHMAAELFSARTGVRMLHVPYQGSAPAMTDLISGRVSIMFGPASTVLELVKSGKLRAIASTGSKRSTATPGLPTVAEEGLPGFESSVWTGVTAPSNLPPAIAKILEGAILAAAASPEVKTQFGVQAIDVVPRGQAEFAAYIKAEAVKWSDVIKTNGLKMN